MSDFPWGFAAGFVLTVILLVENILWGSWFQVVLYIGFLIAFILLFVQFYCRKDH